MKIFFDLDGTLIDASDRLYKLFQNLVPESKLSKTEYWELKRNKVNHKEILRSLFGYSDTQIIHFEKIWMEQIELPEWIRYDNPFENVTAYLKELKNRGELFLVTSRQFEAATIAQIESYGWFDLFKEVLVTRQVLSKSEMIKRIDVSADDWMVGDTGKDIEEGRKAGLLTAGVLSGFLNRSKLEEYHPEIIVDSVTDLIFNQN